MSGRICDDYANSMLAAVIPGGAAFGPPTHLKLALSTADPLRDGSGLVEPTDSAYARQTVDAWTADAANRRIRNTNPVAFPAASADQGTISHWALIDDGDVFVASGPFAASQAVPIGVVLTIAALAAVIDLAVA